VYHIVVYIETDCIGTDNTIQYGPAQFVESNTSKITMYRHNSHAAISWRSLGGSVIIKNDVSTAAEL